MGIAQIKQQWKKYYFDLRKVGNINNIPIFK